MKMIMSILAGIMLVISIGCAGRHNVVPVSTDYTEMIGLNELTTPLAESTFPNLTPSLPEPPLVSASEEMSVSDSRLTKIASTTTNQFRDGEQYIVSLVSTGAVNFQGAGLYCDISLEVSGNGKYYIIPIDIGESTCYTPGVFVGDFTGDGVGDILIKMPTESADGHSPLLGYIYTYDGGKLTEIFSTAIIKDNYSYTVNYKDNYMIEVYSKMLDQYFYGDNTDAFRDFMPLYEDVNAHVTLPYYDKEGRLNFELPHFDAAIVNDMNVYNVITNPVGNGVDNTYKLYISQTIWGASYIDYVGDMLSFLKWDIDSNQFVVIKQTYMPLH